MSSPSSTLDSPAPGPQDGAHPCAIEAHGLGRTFKGGVEAVRSIDLGVAAGEVFGFLGPNGAGKTTTVRMFCTLLPPTAGSARVAGVDVLEGPGGGPPADRRGPSGDRP